MTLKTKYKFIVSVNKKLDDTKFNNRAAYLINAISVFILIIVLLFYFANYHFKIEKVIIRGDFIHTNQDALVNIAKNRLKGNFFTINIVDLKAKFKQIPWIKSIAIKRYFPNVLVLELQEHQPFAIWGKTSGFITEDGVIINEDSCANNDSSDCANLYNLDDNKDDDTSNINTEDIDDFINDPKIIQDKKLLQPQIDLDKKQNYQQILTIYAEDIYRNQSIYYAILCNNYLAKINLRVVKLWLIYDLLKLQLSDGMILYIFQESIKKDLANFIKYSSMIYKLKDTHPREINFSYEHAISIFYDK